MKPSAFSPLVEELLPAPQPEQVFLRMCRLPHCVFLDSALCHPVLGRYCFVAADPFDYLELPADGSDALALLQQRMAELPAARVHDAPAFQGGAAGLLGYDLGRSLEVLPQAATDEFRVPALAVGLYDVVVAIDQVAGRAWLISQGLPELPAARRRRRAQDRLEQVRRWLISDRAAARPPARRTAPFLLPNVPPLHNSAAPLLTPGMPPVARQQLARQYPVEGPEGLSSNFSAEGYLQAVQRAIDYVVAGDVFQVNLAQRLLFPAHEDAVSLYRRLRRCDPAPFAGYFDLGDFQIVSASPERFLQVVDGRVEARPIKGTRPRTGDAQTDRQAEAELRNSQKDRAENIMIVDLLRNDLSRVCRPESVRVGQLCGLEAYEHVLHLVSVVRGQLREDCGPIELLRAAFPGGSITGAPKVRAMEIIAELEPTARGAYCGSLGYLGFDGSLDLSILIRTITAGRGWWQMPVGGGIVAQSAPELEYAETWHKAEGLIRALL